MTNQFIKTLMTQPRMVKFKGIGTVTVNIIPFKNHREMIRNPTSVNPNSIPLKQSDELF